MNENEQDLDLVLSISHRDLLGTSDAWLAERQQLVEGLMRAPEVAAVRRRAQPSVGTRGGISEIVVGIANAGAFAAVIAIAKAWLERDVARNVEVTLKKKDRHITIKAAMIRERNVRALTEMLEGQPSATRDD